MMQTCLTTKYILVILMWIFVIAGSTLANQNQTEREARCFQYGREIEEGIRKFIFTARGKLPKDEKELIKYCKTGEDIFSQIKALKTMSCLSRVQNHIVHMMQPGIKRMMRITCETNREETLINLACLGENQKQRLTKCMNEFSSIQKYIADQKDLEPHLLMPQMCCNLAKLKECIWHNLNAKCRHPDADPPRYLTLLLQPLMKDTLGYLCGRFDQKYCAQSQVAHSLQQRTYVGRPEEFILLPIVRATSRLVL